MEGQALGACRMPHASDVLDSHASQRGGEWACCGFCSGVVHVRFSCRRFPSVASVVRNGLPRPRQSGQLRLTSESLCLLRSTGSRRSSWAIPAPTARPSPSCKRAPEAPASDPAGISVSVYICGDLRGAFAVEASEGGGRGGGVGGEEWCGQELRRCPGMFRFFLSIL